MPPVYQFEDGSERTDLSVSKRGVARFVTYQSSPLRRDRSWILTTEAIFAQVRDKILERGPRPNYCISLGIAFTSIDFLIQCASDLVWTLE